ncbi:hypothetical protein JXL19_09370 [bacterium]|nr:hypothetical protein [bacterium]
MNASSDIIYGSTNETPMNLRFTKGNKNTQKGFSDEITDMINGGYKDG